MKYLSTQTYFLYMLASDLNLSELINFSDGEINLQGRRLVLHDMHANAELRKDLFKMLDTEKTRQIFTRFGYWWGKADAAAMKRLFTWRSTEELLKAGPRLQTLSGVARAVVKDLVLGDGGDSFRMDVIWHNSLESEEQAVAAGKTDLPTCWILTSYVGGFASFCLKKDIYFIEEQCRSKGDKICSAVGKTKEAWGDLIKEHLKFFDLEDVQARIEDLTEQLRRQSQQLQEQRRKAAVNSSSSSVSFPEIRSTAYLRVLDLAERVAPYDSSILITGETGTGKEVLAHHIYSLSTRASKLFLPINCGALPDTLLESELFGHTAGAFTGANHARMGIFEEAAEGTVFLDEIGDISSALQMKLLRVLQEREIVRVGENRPRPVDVRIMAATNRDLTQLIHEGKFREDLYYRLAVVEIHIPPLRDRIEDILSLARHFVKKFSRKLKLPHLRLDPACFDNLQSYGWPGNIRELENAIERAALLCTGELIRPENLPSPLSPLKTDAVSILGQGEITLDELEMHYIGSVLQSTNGNQRKACAILGISQATLWRKLKQQSQSLKQ